MPLSKASFPPSLYINVIEKNLQGSDGSNEGETKASQRLSDTTVAVTTVATSGLLRVTVGLGLSTILSGSAGACGGGGGIGATRSGDGRGDGISLRRGGAGGGGGRVGDDGAHHGSGGCGSRHRGKGSGHGDIDVGTSLLGGASDLINLVGIAVVRQALERAGGDLLDVVTCATKVGNAVTSSLRKSGSQAAESALRDVKGNILGGNDASHGESEESGLHGE